MTPEPVKLFCSYSHKDETFLNELKTSLPGLRQQGLVEEWYDREIVAGQKWEEAIDENLNTSEIVLLLVTPDFMNSDYIREKEMSQALEKHERDEARVIPIIVRPTDWEWSPFSKLQALPRNAKPMECTLFTGPRPKPTSPRKDRRLAVRGRRGSDAGKKP